MPPPAKCRSPRSPPLTTNLYPLPNLTWSLIMGAAATVSAVSTSPPPPLPPAPPAASPPPAPPPPPVPSPPAAASGATCGDGLSAAAGAAAAGVAAAGGAGIGAAGGGAGGSAVCETWGRAAIKRVSWGWGRCSIYSSTSFYRTCTLCTRNKIPSTAWKTLNDWFTPQSLGAPISLGQ